MFDPAPGWGTDAGCARTALTRLGTTGAGAAASTTRSVAATGGGVATAGIGGVGMTAPTDASLATSLCTVTVLSLIHI